MKEEESIVDNDNETLKTTVSDAEGSPLPLLQQSQKEPWKGRRLLWCVLCIAILIIMSVVVVSFVGDKVESFQCGPSISLAGGIGDCGLHLLDWGGNSTFFDDEGLQMSDWGGNCAYMDDEGNRQINRLAQKVVILDKFPNASGSSGIGCWSISSTDYTVCRTGVVRKDKAQLHSNFAFTVVTLRNRSICMSVDNVDYNLQQGGGLFLIYPNDNEEEDDTAVVVQIQADLTKVALDFEGEDVVKPVVDFVRSNEKASALCFPDE